MYERSESRLPWTDKELSYIESRYEKMSLDKMAKYLKRSPRAIKHKAVELSLSSYTGEYLHGKTLAQCFHCDMRVIHRWIHQCNLPAKEVIRGEIRMYLIKPSDFWEWAYHNQNEVMWWKYDRRSLSPEPDWLKDVLRTYEDSNHRKRISSRDKSTVFFMRRKGYTYKQIADELNRSVDSVKHISKSLGLTKEREVSYHVTEM